MPETARKSPEPLIGNRRKDAEFERRIHRIYPERGTTIEDMLTRDYWQHMGREFKPLDKIEAVAEDGTWYAELLVLACDRLWAKVHLLGKWELTTQDVSASQAELRLQDFTIRFIPAKKWCVLDKPKTPGTPPGYLKDQCASKEDAEIWLRGHVKTTT